MTGGARPALPEEHRRAERVFRELDLPLRRLDGLLQGNYEGFLPGRGTEFGEGRLYQPGDDVRRMDWRLTARTAVAHVRDTIADRELELWLVVDVSPSLDFGTGRYLKRDLVAAVVATMNLMTARGGNRLGAVTFGARVNRVLPARTGSEVALTLLSGDEEAARRGLRESGPRDLATALQIVTRLARRRGLVVVISDFLVPAGWQPALAVVSARHDLVAFEIVDPRELELPAVGMLTFVDPETGERIEVQTSNRRLRERYAEETERQRVAIADGLRRGGADHVTLRTDRDWVFDMARFIERRRRLRARGRGDPRLVPR